MSDVVDGRRVRVSGVVPDAEGEIAEGESLVVADEAQDHAELAVGRWQVDLEAGRELRSVAAFGIATAKGLDLDAFSLEPAASLAQRLCACTAGFGIVSSAKAPSLKRTRA